MSPAAHPTLDEALDEELAAPLPDLRARGPLGRAVDGVALLLRGQRLALGHPALKRLSLIIIALNVFLYAGPVAVGSLLLFFFDDWVHELIRQHQHRDWLTATTDGGLEVVVQMLWAGWWMVSLFLSVLVSRLVSGSLLDTLSARCEALYVEGATGARARLRALWRSLKEIGVQLLLLSLHVPVLLLLFAIGKVPEVGPWLATALGWMWTSSWLTLSFIGSVSSRHGVSATGRLRMVLGQKSLCWGLGGLCALVPGLLLPLMLPGLICGGTKLFLALAAHEQIGSDLDDAARAALLSGRRARAQALTAAEAAPTPDGAIDPLSEPAAIQ
jgi:uncharacterized protein involved in cysteine biosynthesis